IRTLHVSAVTGAPRRHVLASIVVSEFQMLAGLTLLMLIGLGIAASGSALSGVRLAWAAAGGVGLALFLAVLLGLSLGDFRLSVRILDLLIRCRIFPKRLVALRASAREMEEMVRTLFLGRRVFFWSQFLSLLAPLCHFVRPTLFFWLLAGGGPGLPSLSQ